MSETPSLGLPLLAAEQAQKHVTLNEALGLVDAILQLSVKDRDLTAPPGSPAEGDRYIIAGGASGAWAGHANEVAVSLGGAWLFVGPNEGWRAWVDDEDVLVIYDGAGWIDAGFATSELQNLALLGIGTEADASNPLAAKLNKILFTARTVAEGGDGDLRYTMNKEGAADVLSLLLQSGFSGRAEIGLIGDDDLTVKVSADGSTWKAALIVDKPTGGTRFLVNEAVIASAATTDIGAAAGLLVSITGTTTITSFGSAANSIKLIRFGDALTLTHDPISLILPTGANITTAADDTAIATSDASGNWRVRDYQRASGASLAGGTGTGDVVGPGSAVDGRIALFDGATGELIKQHTGAPGALAVKNTVATADLDASAITYAKMQDGSAVSVVGRSANSTGVLAAIVAAANDRMLARVGDALDWVQLTIGMIPEALITFAKLASAAVATATELKSATASKLVTASIARDAMDWFAMTFNASQAIDHANGVNQKVTLTGNATFGAPSNAKVGWPLNLWVIQDGTGSRTGSWDAAFDFGDAGAPVLSTAAGAQDLVTFLCMASGSYVFLGIRKAF